MLHYIPLRSRPRGFTLVELLASILILGVLFAISVSSMANLEANSRVERTKTLIARLDKLISEKYESYRTRAIPIRIPPRTTPESAARIRLQVIRELMRMELPDRVGDLTDGPQPIPYVYDGDPNMAGVQLTNGTLPPFPPPAAWRAMKSRMPPGWAADTAQTYPSAECLYAIVSTIRQGDSRAMDFLTPSEIGDIDNDGAPEILDGWGQPILFLRWAPGFVKENGALTLQTKVAADSPDPFDPLKLDARYGDADPSNDPFALKPLIFSAGRDQKFEIELGGGVHYATESPYGPSDPYHTYVGALIGTPSLPSGNGTWTDNITSHYYEVR